MKKNKAAIGPKKSSMSIKLTGDLSKVKQNRYHEPELPITLFVDQGEKKPKERRKSKVGLMPVIRSPTVSPKNSLHDVVSPLFA